MTTTTVPVWDGWVRFTHWAVALGLFANLLITESGSDTHEYVGYTVVGLVISRLVWGVIGSRYARFSDFFPTPTRLRQHVAALKSPTSPVQVSVSDHHLGHNPAGALMMLALWGVILALGVTGYLQTTDRFWGDETVQDIHELLANSLYLLVPIHVISAIVMGRLQKQNLIKAMITGKKTVHVSTSTDARP